MEATMANPAPRTTAEIQADLEELQALRDEAARRADEHARIASGIFEELSRRRAAELAMAAAQAPDAASTA